MIGSSSRARVFRPFALRQRPGELLMGDAKRLHEAQHGIGNMLGGPYTPNGARTGPAGWRRDRARLPADHRLAALADQHGLHKPGLIAAAAWRMQHEGAAADGGAVDPGRLMPIMADLLRAFDRGGKAVDVESFSPASAIVQRRIRVKLELRHARMTPSSVVSAHRRRQPRSRWLLPLRRRSWEGDLVVDFERDFQPHVELERLRRLQAIDDVAIMRGPSSSRRRR